MRKSFLFLAVVAIVAQSVLAQLGETIKDRLNGYSMAAPDKWPKVPTQPGEEYIVGKWGDKRDIGNIASEISVLRFKKVAPPQKGEESLEDEVEGLDPGELTEEELRAKIKELSERAFRPAKFASYADWLKVFDNFNEKLPNPTKELTIKGQTQKAKIYHTITKVGTLGNRPVNLWSMHIVMSTPDAEWAIRFDAEEPRRRKMEDVFTDVARSFRLIDRKEAELAMDAEALAGLSEKARALRVARISTLQVPGWWIKEGSKYVIVTGVPKEKSESIDEVMVRLNWMRKQYEKDFPTAAPIEAVSVVRVCQTEKEYHDYGGPGGSAGYWNSHAKELVLYMSREKGLTLSVLNHEAFHQYIYYCFGELAPHSWFNEGYGDYYAGCEPNGRTMAVKPFKWRVDTIKTAIRQGKHVPVKDIIRFTQQQYYSNPSICYAEGWSLIWFLNRGLPKDHEWRDILPTYFNTLQETKSMEKAVEAAFANVDIEAFEKAWAEFITKDRMAPMTGKSKGVKIKLTGGSTSRPATASRPTDGE